MKVSAGGWVLPKSPMGQAITYVLNQWEALTVNVTDGELQIDNNSVEHALRRIAVGRKNWLFAGSDRGSHAAAILFSLIASCPRHVTAPFSYLRDVPTRIAAHSRNRLADLPPHRRHASACPRLSGTLVPPLGDVRGVLRQTDSLVHCRRMIGSAAREQNGGGVFGGGHRLEFDVSRAVETFLAESSGGAQKGGRPFRVARLVFVRRCDWRIVAY